MMQKRILVPLGPSAKDFKSIHYALSLAERLDAQVYILQQGVASNYEDPFSACLNEALLDLINAARQARLTVSHLIAEGGLKEEIIGLVKALGIDVLVFSLEDGIQQHLVHQLKPLFTGQIIQVKEKNDLNYL